MSSRPLYFLLIEPGVVGLSTRKMILEQANHNLFKVGSGAEALTLAPKFPFDAVVLDMRVQDLPVLELVSRLRQANKTMRIVAVGGQGEPERLRAAVDLYLPLWEPATCIQMLEEFLGVASE